MESVPKTITKNQQTPDSEEQLRYFRGTVLHFEDPTEPVSAADWEALLTARCHCDPDWR